MTAPSIAEIASKLPVTQRNNLLLFRDGEDYPFWAVFGLLHRGLAVYRKRWFLFGPRGGFLTRTGRLVRYYLANAAPTILPDNEHQESGK